MGQSVLFKAVVLAGFAVAVSACSPAGTPLAGDLTESSKCPPGGCADSAPDQDQLTLTASGKTTLYQTPLKNGGGQIIDMIEIAGDCYASTYPNNRVEVTLYYSTSRVTLSSTDVIDGSYPGGQPKCRNGRFNFAINGARLTAGLTYRIQAELIGIAADGSEYRNAGTGVYKINVAR